MSQPIATRVLILDPVGLRPGSDGKPDISEVQAHIEARGGVFHPGSAHAIPALPGRVNFYYLPHLSTGAAILAEAAEGSYDAVIAAATPIPAGAIFPRGGVRIGAGTGNMGSASWGGGDGIGGPAPLMNTPGVNARATAQMVFKALLRIRPDLPVETLSALTAAGDFDTGRDLAQYPTAKLEGQIFAVLGYGNIGREVALLAQAFGMRVRIYARPRHRDWIESEGFEWSPTPATAARGAHVLSLHLGLGARTEAGFANAGIVGAEVLQALAPGAIVLNYDRGELIDTAALDLALAGGQVSCAAIDADLFRDAETGHLSGPMVAYLPLASRYGARLNLLPHAAADTDHPSRVEGAIRAVDQILSVLEDGVVYNLKGDLPPGLVDGGPSKPPCIGGVGPKDLAALAGDAHRLGELAALAREVSALLSRLPAGGGEDIGSQLMRSWNLLAHGMRAAGLHGPYHDGAD